VAAPKKYPDELRERAVRVYRETRPRPVIRRLAEQLGVHHEALRNWIRQDEANRGERTDRPTTAETEELRRLRKENAELRRANEILKGGERFFRLNVSMIVPGGVRSFFRCPSLAAGGLSSDVRPRRVRAERWRGLIGACLVPD
jgi:transposase